MKIPQQFTDMARVAHADIDLEVNSDVEFVHYLTEGLSREKRAVVHRFLDDLLATDPSVGTLQAVWKATGADSYIGDQGVCHIFKMLRDATV